MAEAMRQERFGSSKFTPARRYFAPCVQNPNPAFSRISRVGRNYCVAQANALDLMASVSSQNLLISEIILAIKPLVDIVPLRPSATRLYSVLA
jgi:hypothetical protein